MSVLPLRKTRAVFALLSLLSTVQMCGAADNPGAEQVVARMAHLFSSTSSIATLTMQISNEDGQRNLSMKIWSSGDKVLIRIAAPQKEAGIAILKNGDDISYYLPKSNRTVQIPASVESSSWLGSDFTIDDLVKETFLARDYSVSESFQGMREGVMVDEYTLLPKADAAVVWGKIVLRVRQADNLPAWQGFYDESGQLIRELIFSDFRTMGGRLIPTRLIMRSTQKLGHQTTIVYQDLTFGAHISQGTFSLTSLK